MKIEVDQLEANCLDNLEECTLNISNTGVDLTNGVVTPDSVNSVTFSKCLVRMLSDRNYPSNKQIYEKSIGSFSVEHNVFDGNINVLLEKDAKDGSIDTPFGDYKIRLSDTITRTTTGETFSILSIDFCNNGGRLRLGVRRKRT